MSDQLTSQSRPSQGGISRRTALRGAAWSASAVTVVVATPNIAAASGGATGTAGPSTASREGNTLEVRSSLTAGPATLSGIQAVVTLTFASAGPSIVSAGVKGWSSWSATGFSGLTATFTLGSLAAGQTAPFEPLLGLGDARNITGTFTIHYTWSGNADGATTGGTFAKN